ncbi:MAG TPA: polysaccharide deacetylase family protein [Micromonospora sp.]
MADQEAGMDLSSRYDYSAIVDRPPMVLPGGARVALWLIFNVEHYEYLPPPHPLRDPWPSRPHPDVVNYARRDYGNRIGVWRMLDLLDRYALRATISVNSAVLDHFPAIAEELARRDVDFMGHGVYNTRYAAGLDPDAERAMIADVVDTVARRTGRPVSGWLGPALTTTPVTPDLVAEAGIRYLADYLHDDEPCPIRVRAGELMSVPYSLALNDSPMIGRMQHSADTFARLVTDQFEVYHEEGRVRPKVLALCLHPYAVNAPSRQRMLQRLLEHLAGHPDVWVATGSEIAEVGRVAWAGAAQSGGRR